MCGVGAEKHLPARRLRVDFALSLSLFPSKKSPNARRNGAGVVLAGWRRVKIRVQGRMVALRRKARLSPTVLSPHLLPLLLLLGLGSPVVFLLLFFCFFFSCCNAWPLPFPPLVFHLAGAPLEPANHHRIPYNDQRNKKEEK